MPLKAFSFLLCLLLAVQPVAAQTTGGLPIERGPGAVELVVSLDATLDRLAEPVPFFEQGLEGLSAGDRESLSIVLASVLGTAPAAQRLRLAGLPESQARRLAGRIGERAAAVRRVLAERAELREAAVRAVSGTRSRSESAEALHGLRRAPDEVAGRLETALIERGLAFEPGAKAKVARVSLGRAWTHSFFGWKQDREALRTPLTSSDHLVLTAASFLPGTILTSLLTLASTPRGAERAVLFGALGGWNAFVGWGLGSNHWTETRDGRAVVRGARRLKADPSIGFDENLLDIAAKFQQATGWSIAWTDKPWLLAKVEPDAKRLVMSAGWIAKAVAPKDDRRLAYLTDVLRIVRHAAERDAAIKDGVRDAVSVRGFGYERAGRVPKVSMRRALGHRWESWKKSALALPLTASDHAVLAGLAVFFALGASGAMVALLGALSWAAGVSLAPGALELVFAFSSIITALIYPLGHLRETRDGGAVVRNALRLQTEPTAPFDEKLVGLARRFEKDTGWKVVFTDEPWLLAKAEPESRRVVMSVGWLVESPLKADRRRLAYLTHVLRTLRKAIDAEAVKKR